MSKARIIQIEIPKPCSQNLDEMAATDNGRFCTHCQKNVIDFSTWSDTALYNFFSKNKDHVCGRFLATQLERPIQIPYQPHSKLYRIAIALGLTLVFTQTPHALAQNRPPKTEQSSILKQTEPDTNKVAVISGRIFDDRKEPLPSAIVQLFQNGIFKGGAATDYNGNYTITLLESGNYDVLALYTGYDSLFKKGVIVSKDTVCIVDFTFVHSSKVTFFMGIISYPKPLFDMDNPTKRTFTRDEINNTPK